MHTEGYWGNTTNDITGSTYDGWMKLPDGVSEVPGVYVAPAVRMVPE